MSYGHLKIYEDFIKQTLIDVLSSTYSSDPKNTIALKLRKEVARKTKLNVALVIIDKWKPTNNLSISYDNSYL